MGWLGAAVSVKTDFDAMTKGEISAERFAYRTTGAVSGLVGGTAIGLEVAGPWGALGGAFISTGFTAAEMAYDGYTSWQTQMAQYLTNFENGIKGGWMPR